MKPSPLGAGALSVVGVGTVMVLILHGMAGGMSISGTLHQSGPAEKVILGIFFGAFVNLIGGILGIAALCQRDVSKDAAGWAVVIGFGLDLFLFIEIASL